LHAWPEMQTFHIFKRGILWASPLAMKKSLLSAQFVFLAFVFSVPALGQNANHKKKFNDSARYYLDLSQSAKSNSVLQKSLTLKSSDEKENARAYLLLGESNEADGYVFEANKNYRLAYQTAKTISDKFLLTSVLNGIASSLIGLDEIDSVEFYCHTSFQLDSISDENRIANCLLLGRYWQSKNQNDKAFKQFQLAVELAKNNGDKKSHGFALAGLASVYFNQYSDMNQARDYYHQALAVLDSGKHANQIARIYTRIANTYMVDNNGVQARNYLTRAKRIIDVSNNLPVKSYVLASLAILKTEEGDIKEVIRYAEEALAIKRQLGQRRQLQNDLLNLSEWYLQVKEYTKARKMLTEAMALARELNDVVYLHYFYETTALLDSLTGNTASAYSNLKKAMFFKDSTYTIRKIKAVEEIKEKYENEQKEKTIAEKELIIQSQKYQQSVIVGVAVITILILLLILLWIWTQQKIKLQRQQEHQNRIRLQTIVHTQEEVQQSIARDLHDGLVQVLGAAKMSLQAVNINGDKELVHQRIKDASVIIDEACSEARNISHQILPYSLMKDGLLPAIEELLRKNLPGIKYKFEFENVEKRFHQDVEINFYRIAQELIQNILKHSEATFVKIRFHEKNNFLVLDLADNGKGFDKNSDNDGVGLTNIKTRAELINASVLVDTNPETGTRIMVQAQV
jgi:two-component system NarL family sensor kinase